MISNELAFIVGTITASFLIFLGVFLETTIRALIKKHKEKKDI